MKYVIFDHEKVLYLSYGHNCYGHDNLEEYQPQETPLQGAAAGFIRSFRALQVCNKFWWPHNLSCCHTACLGRHTSICSDLRTLFNDSIVYAPDNLII